MTGFDALLEHVPALRRYARLLTGDAARADDLVQDTLERAHRKGALWREGSMRSWLLTLMHNLHLNQRRDQRLEVQVADDATEAAHDPTPRLGVRLDLVQALERLSPQTRAVLLLVTVEEYSYAEAAAILDVPIGTVMSRLHRAREQLRHWMTEPEQPPVRLVKP
ncbi:MAG: RNA polymerase sigma factor [Burkholderiales bacterium]|nr:RNA polymerase sigma factor [Burkholderiales bacterium]